MLDEVLYHATFKENIPSIIKNGLGGNRRPNWDESEKGAVYFANDAETAYGFCESAPLASESAVKSGIVMLAVSKLALNQDKFENDYNLDQVSMVFGFRPRFYIYRGIIPSHILHVIDCYEGDLGLLVNFNNVPLYDSTTFLSK